MRYFKKLIGKKCYLSPMNLDDLEKYTTWLNDQEVVQYLNVKTLPISLSTEIKALESLCESHTYGIVDIEKEELIGNCGFTNWDQIDRTASVGIFLGNKNYWNKGYGQEALSLLIDYGFRLLNIQNIMLSVLEFNERGRHCYEKIGFKEIGRRRKSRYINLKYCDEIFMDILPEDFFKESVKK